MYSRWRRPDRFPSLYQPRVGIRDLDTLNSPIHGTEATVQLCPDIPSTFDFWAAAGIFLISFASYICLTDLPPRNDEVAMYYGAVDIPWSQTVSKYYAPQNHILYAVFTKLSCVFSDRCDLFFIRLPAVIFGAIIPVL
jgi:hypothetical protein